MAFRASNQTTADAYASIKRQSVATKSYLQTQNAAMQAATCSASVPVAVIQHYQQVIALMDSWTAVPGIAAYAQSVENDPAYDVVAEYQAMRTAMVSARDQLIAMFPTSTGGFMAYQTLNADGTITVRSFTAAQLAPVVTLNNSVIATIS